MPPPVIVQVYEGSSATLNWSYSLSLGLSVGAIRFNGNRIVSIQSDGSAGSVAAEFQERFYFSSTLGRASLFITPVSIADDKANGKFRCELIDTNIDTWKRAIKLQVIGKLESVADHEEGIPKL